MGNHPRELRNPGIKNARRESNCLIFTVFWVTYGHKVVDQTVIEVLSSQMGVTSGRFDLENTIFDRKDGDIKSSAAKIENKDVTLSSDLFVQTVSDGGRGGFVDDSKNVKAGNGTSILGSLTLTKKIK